MCGRAVVARGGAADAVGALGGRAPRLGQRCRKLALLALIAVAGWPAEARAEGTSWLEWSPQPGCPGEDEIERRVVEWVGAPLPEAGELFVRTTLVQSGGEWEVGVVITRDGQSGERRVSVTSCEAAADFVAIAVALAVDPGLAERIESDAAPASPVAAAVDPPESSAAPVAEQEAQLPRDRTSPRPARPDTGARGRPHAEVPPSRRPPDDVPRNSWRLHTTLSAEDAWRTLPHSTAGVGLGVGADHGRWSVSLGTRWLLPVTESPERATAPIEFSLRAGRGTVAYRLLGPRVQFGPLLALEGGAVLARQQGATPDPVIEPWWLCGVGAGAFVALSAGVGLTGEVELSVPLTQPTFVLTDGSQVYQVGPGGRGLLGVRLFFDSR